MGQPRRGNWSSISLGLAVPPNPSPRLRRSKQQDGEGTHRPAREALRLRHHPPIQEDSSVLLRLVRFLNPLVQAAPCRSKSYQYGITSLVQIEGVNTRMTWRRTAAIRWHTYTRPKKEQRHPLWLHLRQGLPPSRQHWGRSLQVHVQVQPW